MTQKPSVLKVYKMAHHIFINDHHARSKMFWLTQDISFDSESQKRS